MRISSACRAPLLALATAFGSFGLSSAAYAASVFGASETHFRGTVSNIRSPYDVAGIYGAAGAGGAVIVGAQAIVLRNEKGALLRLAGRQVGLQVNADLSGLSISVR